MLPNSIGALQNVVQKVPAGICEAFFEALDAAIAACTRVDAKKDIKSAGDYLKFIRSDSQYTETLLAKVVYLQGLILMIIATSNIGPSYKFKTDWIVLAVAAAEDLKLHHVPRYHDPKDPDMYTRGDIGRRAWLILYILDRWHGLGNPDVLHIPEDNCPLIDSDYDLLGDHPYHLFRRCCKSPLLNAAYNPNTGLSRIVGHLCQGYTFQSQGMEELYLHRGALAMTLNGEMNSFRESVYKRFATMPHIHLAYLHVRNIAHRYLVMNITQTRKVVDSTYEIVTLLKADKGIYNMPWIHQIIALAALTLGKVADLQMHPGATAGLQDLRNGLDTSQFRRHNGNTGWDVAISASITKRLGNGGLGQLADAAMGETDAANGTGDHGDSPSFESPPDWTQMVSQGYLNAFD